ncbi:hypothetical protein Mrose_01302 [Calidithermus roseus]|uniref:ParB/Spo0J HTH domain-containing protein n=1 Tax=Calidithermus roseus TaxID=1644118 RepID=A0A399EV10_9DEIN|nr:hypothetical protein Mrose_01302 [Calidithermus roseus]
MPKKRTSYEETLSILTLLEMKLGKGREEVVSLLHRMQKESRGKAAHNVMGHSDAVQVEEIFKGLGRLTWESFVQNRLPLLNLPDDLKEALEEGAIPYTAALELERVKEQGDRARLLEEARAGLSLRDLKARVRALLKHPPSAARPWHREVLTKLARIDLEALPAGRRTQVEEKLRELAELLEG